MPASGIFASLPVFGADAGSAFKQAALDNNAKIPKLGAYPNIQIWRRQFLPLIAFVHGSRTKRSICRSRAKEPQRWNSVCTSARVSLAAWEQRFPFPETS
jgi:hypothetical protein